MAEYLFKGELNKQSGNVKVKILLFHFQDENKIHFIYSPHLDLTGYGNNLSDAKKSFEIVLDDFFDYTLKKKTVAKVLTKLGWNVKGSRKKPEKVIAPSITTVIKENDFVSEIFDKYPVHTFHKQVGIPAYA